MVITEIRPSHERNTVEIKRVPSLKLEIRGLIVEISLTDLEAQRIKNKLAPFSRALRKSGVRVDSLRRGQLTVALSADKCERMMDNNWSHKPLEWGEFCRSAAERELGQL